MFHLSLNTEIKSDEVTQEMYDSLITFVKKSSIPNESYLGHRKILNCNLIRIVNFTDNFINTENEFRGMPKPIVAVSMSKDACMSDVADMTMVAAYSFEPVWYHQRSIKRNLLHLINIYKKNISNHLAPNIHLMKLYLLKLLLHLRNIYKRNISNHLASNIHLLKLCLFKSLWTTL